MFFKLFFCLEKIFFAVGKLLFFFQLFFIFLGAMHTQEARNNVFQIKFGKKFFHCRQIIIFYSSKISSIFSLFLGPFDTQEARNNVFQIVCLLAGNSKKKYFSLSANYYFFPALFLFLRTCTRVFFYRVIIPPLFSLRNAFTALTQ